MWLILGLGLVLVIEGLVVALAPSRLADAVAMLRRIPVDTRRMIGLSMVAAGVFMVWMVKGAV